MVTPSRRSFLKYLLGTTLASTMDVEKLIWTPSPIVVVPDLPNPHRHYYGKMVADAWVDTLNLDWKTIPSVVTLGDEGVTERTFGHIILSKHLWDE